MWKDLFNFCEDLPRNHWGRTVQSFLTFYFYSLERSYTFLLWQVIIFIWKFICIEIPQPFKKLLLQKSQTTIYDPYTDTTKIHPTYNNLCIQSKYKSYQLLWSKTLPNQIPCWTLHQSLPIIYDTDKWHMKNTINFNLWIQIRKIGLNVCQSTQRAKMHWKIIEYLKELII